MKRWVEEYRTFWKHKGYVLAVVLTALASYGFLVTHQTIGIDDTPCKAYFEDGLAAIVGRWVLFLLNKAVHIADFAPFLTDLAGVLIFLLAVTVWCTLWKRIFGECIPMYGYILFSCLFLSNPLISEVYTYYLHNGIAIGYLCTGIALCAFWEGVEQWHSGRSGKNRKALKAWGISIIGVWVALGCYESFMIVYLVGVCIVLASAGMAAREQRVKVFRMLCAAAGVAAAAIVLRSLMVAAVTAVFGLQELQDAAVQRSVTELLGWMAEENAFAEFAMALKRVYVMYGVFAYAYYPIAIYLLASVIIVVAALWKTISRRNIWILVLTFGSFVASYLLVVIEGKATLYRSAQFLPLFSAWGLLLAVFLVQEGIRKEMVLRWCHRILGVVLAVILWNQCTEMNKWFYVDYLKYEDAKNTMNQIAYELEKNFDTSKPVIFTGNYKMPNSILADTYVPYNSETFYKLRQLTVPIDEHLLDKFYQEYGVWVPQTPSLSVLEWGRSAFGTDEELTRFFAMHGHDIKPYMDSIWEEPDGNSEYMKAALESAEWPSFPKEGSIQDMGEYIIVHF